MLLLKISQAQRVGIAISNVMILYFILIITLIAVPPIILIILTGRKAKRIVESHKLNTIQESNSINYVKDFYNDVDCNCLKLVEKAKLKIKIVQSTLITSLISFLIIILLNSINSEFKNSGSAFFLVILVVITVISVFLRTKLEKDYKKIFFETYAPKLLDQLKKDIKINPILNSTDMVNIVNVPVSSTSTGKMESQDDYNNAMFYTKKHLFYKNQELININYNGNDIKLRSVITEVYSILSKRKTEELFRGIFACAKCNYNPGSYINISTEQAVNKKLNNEKYKFTVSNSSSNYNYGLLSYELLELINNFYLNSGINFEITYSNNNIYFRFFTGNNLYPSLKSDSTNSNILNKYYLIIKFIIEFIEIKKGSI